MKNIAIIVGAGSGERFGSYKQVETINNKPVYKYSIDAFLDSECFSQIILAVPKKLLNVILNQLNEDRYKDIIVCEGGNTCLLYTSPSPRDVEESRMPSSA